MHHTCCSCACTVYHHTDWISYYWLFLFIGKQHPKLDDFKWKINYFSIWIKMQKIFEVEINYTLIFVFTNWSIYKSIVIFPFFSWSKWMKAVLTCTACILTLYMYITLLGIDMLWNVPIWFLSAIFNAEFILSGVMRQTVDFKSYQIDVHWFNSLWLDVHVKTLCWCPLPLLLVFLRELALMCSQIRKVSEWRTPPLPNTHSRRVCDTEVFEKYSQGMTTFNQN